MPSQSQVPEEIVARLRLACLDLPEAYEEAAWVGTRWMVRKKNFAHVLMINEGSPPSYAQAARLDGPVCVLTFRSARPALDSPRFKRPPFFRPVWFPNIVGMVIDMGVDWDEVTELLIKSYCVMAPKKLVERLEGA